MKIIFTTVIILTVLVTPLEAQWLQRRTPRIPRTADGKPDLTAAPACGHAQVYIRSTL